MTFDQFGPEDEDDDVPPALMATACEILPATLLKSIVTPNQMERIGDDGSSASPSGSRRWSGSSPS